MRRTPRLKLYEKVWLHGDSPDWQAFRDEKEKIEHCSTYV